MNRLFLIYSTRHTKGTLAGLNTEHALPFLAEMRESYERQFRVGRCFHDGRKITSARILTEAELADEQLSLAELEESFAEDRASDSILDYSEVELHRRIPPENRRIQSTAANFIRFAEAREEEDRLAEFDY